MNEKENLYNEIKAKDEVLKDISLLAGDALTLIHNSIKEDMDLTTVLASVSKSIYEMRGKIETILLTSTGRSIKSEHLKIIKACFRLLFTSEIFDKTTVTTPKIEIDDLKKRIVKVIGDNTIFKYYSFLESQKKMFVATPRAFLFDLSEHDDFKSERDRIILSVEKLRGFLKKLDISEFEARDKFYLIDTRTRDILSEKALGNGRFELVDQIQKSDCWLKKNLIGHRLTLGLDE